MHPELNDKRANLDKMMGYIEQGLKAGADIIAFGECALVGYELTGMVDYEGLAEPVPGPSTAAISELLKGKRTLVLLGMAERVRDDVYNAAPLIGADGVIGTARKLYLVNFRAKTSGRIYAESIPFKHGERIAIFDTAFGRIGVLICLDNRHPEIACAQAIAGCWLKLRPAAIPYRVGQPDITPLDLARGIENQMCDCTVNLVGQQGDSWYRGGSSVILGSRGLTKQASFGKQAVEEVLEYDITEEEVYAARGAWHNVREVRPDLLRQLWEIGSEYQSGSRKH